MPKAYITIEDFKAGLDTRRLATSAAPGSLQQFKNGHINRGGEIIKSKKWSPKYTLPAGTFGMAASSGRLYVFGSSEPPSGIPGDISYQRLRTPDSANMTAIVQTQPFAGKTYVLAAYDDGKNYHFYDGTIVKDWYLGQIRASHGSYQGFLNEVAADMANDPTVTVSVSGNTMTITGKQDNDAFDVSVSSEAGGVIADETISVVLTQTATASLPQISTVTLGGTFDPGDKFTIQVEDNTYGASPVTGAKATCIQTHKNKMYAGAGKDLFCSCVADPALWRNNIVGATINTGAGVYDMSAQASDDEDISALGVYLGSLAVYTRNVVQIWSMSANTATSTQLQVLDNTGTRSPGSVRSFGDMDQFFLDSSGVRSLRARDSSNSASVTDVGTPIDDLVISAADNLSDASVQAAVSAIEPKDGRYIMAMDAIMYVFSYFSTSKISAWSTYEPNLVMTDFAVINGRLYGRAGNTIYILGGDNDDEYVEEKVVIELPYISAQTIATWKRWIGLDVVLTGTWDIYVNTNPLQPDEWIKTARVTDTSIGQMKLAMQQNSPVLKLKFEHEGEGEARISQVIVHYESTWAG